VGPQFVDALRKARQVSSGFVRFLHILIVC
jgi:hypothetical protein